MSTPATPDRSPFYIVGTDEDLRSIHVAQVPDGQIAVVQTPRSIWILFKRAPLSPIPPGTTFVVPFSGSPIAGAADAFWLKLNDVPPGL